MRDEENNTLLEGSAEVTGWDSGRAQEMKTSVAVASPHLGSRQGAVELRSSSFPSELLCDLRRACVSWGPLPPRPGNGREGALQSLWT